MSLTAEHISQTESHTDIDLERVEIIIHPRVQQAVFDGATFKVNISVGTEALFGASLLWPNGESFGAQHDRTLDGAIDNLERELERDATGQA